MARLTAAQVAARLKGDNRTVVGSKDPGGSDQDLVATDLGPVGTEYGLANASTATAAAYEVVADGTGEIVVPVGSFDGSDLSKNALRTQYFTQKESYDATKAGFGAKRCFVNDKYQPLDANGQPTTVADAVDAETTDLTALGEAVTNYAQVYKYDGERTPVPGTYTANERQTSLYAPYSGYTAQHDIP